VTQSFCVWVDRDLVAAMLPVIVADIHERVDAADDEYVRRMFEGILKKTLEEVRAGREDALRRLGRALEPMQAALKRQPYVCGENAAYADFALVLRIPVGPGHESPGGAGPRKPTLFLARSACSTCTMASPQCPVA